MKPHRQSFWLSGSLSLLYLVITSPLRAQIIQDATLPNSSTVTRDGNTSVITGGTQAGPNLFHSFREFSVPINSVASFRQIDQGIENIISRVTESNVSNIDGLIEVLEANGTVSKANFFLLNPNGIIFGPNAQLNIGGSFLASTASSLNFADGAQFSATTPQTTPLLTVTVPLGLQFGETPGSIVNQSRATNSSDELVGLQVQPDKTLALVGGNVSLDGGILRAPGGRVELGGVAGAGTVGLNVDGNYLNLSFADSVASADVLLTKAVIVDITPPENSDVGARGGGTIAINAGNISIENDSRLFAQTMIAEVIAGNILMRANGNVSITNNSRLYSLALTGKGKAGIISVQANGDVSITINSTLSTTTFEATSEAADAGSISVEANGNVFIIDQSSLSSGAFGGQGDAGSVSVRANGNVFINKSSISSRLDNKASIRSNNTAGQGNIILNSQNLMLHGSSSITTNATDKATGGNITIDTGVIVALENSDISANSTEFRGGQVKINAQGIFGTESRDAPTSESDITATGGSPELSGTVQINTPDVNPSVGLVTLPTELVDASGLIPQTCPAGGGQGQSEFIVTGRGGLPENPSDSLSSDAVEGDLVTLYPKVENRSSPVVSTNSISPAFTQIVEAQGWVINNKGEVVLTASTATVTPKNPWITQTTCHGFEMNDTKITRSRFA